MIIKENKSQPKTYLGFLPQDYFNKNSVKILKTRFANQLIALSYMGCQQLEIRIFID
ncbi:unnamed protein product [Paramecium sonneborni]|uniref:Uncharacterized protein n=1 Tax=Paramecium sonneborni TaxID=65129 RepID=A0A8S1QW56_9CILI|nr:unnamed protein product [Paramecium sonneborni]